MDFPPRDWLRERQRKRRKFIRNMRIGCRVFAVMAGIVGVDVGWGIWRSELSSKTVDGFLAVIAGAPLLALFMVSLRTEAASIDRELASNHVANPTNIHGSSFVATTDPAVAEASTRLLLLFLVAMLGGSLWMVYRQDMLHGLLIIPFTIALTGWCVHRWSKGAAILASTLRVDAAGIAYDSNFVPFSRPFVLAWGDLRRVVVDLRGALRPMRLRLNLRDSSSYVDRVGFWPSLDLLASFFFLGSHFVLTAQLTNAGEHDLMAAVLRFKPDDVAIEWLYDNRV
ncbi:MAG: hypothetical protein IT562_07315 [Alphaproteobacteria bacterium]|nr:hypothetical protein [Alphaproteobacteria bacterium]